jgi:hypothetical protein
MPFPGFTTCGSSILSNLRSGNPAKARTGPLIRTNALVKGAYPAFRQSTSTTYRLKLTHLPSRPQSVTAGRRVVNRTWE